MVVMFDSPAAKTFPVKSVPNLVSTRLTVNAVSPVLVTLYVYVTDEPFSTLEALAVLVKLMAVVNPASHTLKLSGKMFYILDFRFRSQKLHE